MKFQTTTITGYGRGRELGFPTVNMVVPDEVPINLRPGIYAAKAKIKGKKYIGALYYGPVPTFKQDEPTLEIYLFDTIGFYLGKDEEIEIDTVKFIRPVQNFDSPELLVLQMEKDVADIREVFANK